MATQARRRRIDGDVEQFISERLADGWGSGQIRSSLEQDDAFRGRVPNIKTIQRMAREFKAARSESAWQISDVEPRDATAILDVLAEVVEVTQGRVKTFSVDVAKRVALLRRSRPDIAGWDAWLSSSIYVAREAGDIPTDDLDLYLAFAPWRDKQALDRYTDAVVEYRIPAAPSYFELLSRSDAEIWLDSERTAHLLGSWIWLAEASEKTRQMWRAGTAPSERAQYGESGWIRLRAWDAWGEPDEIEYLREPTAVAQGIVRQREKTSDSEGNAEQAGE